MTGPLYTTGFVKTETGLKPLIGGIYAMKDQEGFPVEISVMYCQEKDILIDWYEFLADAGRQTSADKFLDAEKELVNSGCKHVAEIKAKFAFCVMQRSEPTFRENCQAIWEEKQAEAKKIEQFFKALETAKHVDGKIVHPEEDSGGCPGT